MLRQLWIDIRVRVLGLFRRGRLYSRADEEIRTHMAMRAQRLVESGVPAEEARFRAHRKFGNPALVRETSVEAWPFRLVDQAIQDVRQGVRSLGRSRGFAMAAVATIALGIGLNTGVFTVLNGVLLREIPATDPKELVSIQQTVEGGEFTAVSGQGAFTISEYRTYAERSRTMAGILAHSNPWETTLGGEQPREVLGTLVSCNYFAVLETPPVIGRGFDDEDCAADANPVAVLGHRLWRTDFAADPGILGRTVELDRSLFTVVGVAAEGTYGGSGMSTAYLAPLNTERLLGPERSRYEDEAYAWLNLIGRRGDRTSVSEVRSELDVIAGQIDAEQPGRVTRITVERPKALLVREMGTGLTVAATVLMAPFGFVLLIACANVANLLLARGTARKQEIGIRLALGASRKRIVGQLLTESLLISLAGGLIGSLLTLWSFQALIALAIPGVIPPEMPGIVLDLDFSPDFRVLAFAVGLTLITGILFGLAPALETSRPDLSGVIKQDSAGSGASRRGGRLRAALVGVQVALCMALMSGTGLLLRGLYAAYTVDPGFSYENVLFVSYGTDYGPPEVLDQSLMDEVRALPGVESVAYAAQTPLGESRMGMPVRLPGASEEDEVFVEWDLVTPDYFAVLEIPIVRGRTFTASESADVDEGVRLRPAIVSETTAHNFWGESDPIGRTLVRGDVTLEVVGVAADAQLMVLGTIPPYYVFEPRGPGGILLVKNRAELAATASSVLAILLDRDPSQAVRVLPLEANVEWFRGLSGVVTALGGGLGFLALALASIGIYGVVSYAVTRRYREIGIRIALGATAANVQGLILRQTMRPVAVGALVGAGAALAVSGILASVLFGVSPLDPVGLGGAVLLVLGVGLSSGLAAARPATRIDPTAMLRRE